MNDDLLEDDELSAFDEDLLNGEVRLAKKLILRLGKKRFGEPDSSVTGVLEPLGIDDLDRLERIIERISETESWQELLSSQ